ncbi:MAG TPA: hydrolase [Myxococcales bacterium]|nr:hydrolase [Myxococcales bacterium]
MQTQPVQSTGCCPPFDPEPWKDREIVWRDKLFLKDRVHSVLHVPIDMGRKMVRNQRRIEAAHAQPLQPLTLTDENSRWGADIYLEVTAPVPGVEMARMSGTFLTRVYEGPYRNAPTWAEDMRQLVQARGRTLEKLYFAYTTCPRCARAYGRNYVVLFAKVGPPN